MDNEIKEALLCLKTIKSRIKTAGIVFCIVLILGMLAIHNLKPNLVVWICVGMSIHNVMYFMLVFSLNKEKKRCMEKIDKLQSENAEK